jgi:hypothetical protein
MSKEILKNLDKFFQIAIGSQIHQQSTLNKILLLFQYHFNKTLSAR